jgi:hypothetical protein
MTYTIFQLDAHQYSLATIENASAPGNTIYPVVSRAFQPENDSSPKTLNHPSKIMLTTPSVTAMTGVNQYIVAKGLVIPISGLCMTSCVSAQRRPPRAEAVKTMMMPGIETVVALKTIKKTPNVMKAMTKTSLWEYASSLNRKANPRTKIRDEDLHIAGRRGSSRQLAAGAIASETYCIMST